jgi:hypothetical protein
MRWSAHAMLHAALTSAALHGVSAGLLRVAIAVHLARSKDLSGSDTTPNCVTARSYRICR